MIKIKLKDLKPNPFRSFEDCPLEEIKLEALMISIQRTDFWDNILVRTNVTELNPNGDAQLAYGHHRLEAVKRIHGDEYWVELPSKDIDDDNMLRIVGEENSDIYFKDGQTDITALDGFVKQVWERLLSVSDLNLVRPTGGGPLKLVFTDLPIPSVSEYTCIAKQIQNWLGTNWGEDIINNSILNLRAKGKIQFPEVKEDKEGNSVTTEATVKIEDEEGNVEESVEEVVDVVLVDQEEVLDEKALGMMDTKQNGNKFRQMITKIHNRDHELVLEMNQGKVEPEKQRQIASNIIAKVDIMPKVDAYSRPSMDLEAVRVIDGEERANEIEFTDFRDNMTALVKLTNNLSGKYKAMNNNIQESAVQSGFLDLFKITFQEFKLEFAIVKLSKEIGRLVDCVPEQETIKEPKQIKEAVIDVTAEIIKGDE